MVLTPDPGSNLSTAYIAGTINGRSNVFSDAVSTTDLNDYLRFTLNTSASSLSVSLSGLSANANLQVIRDANNNGVVDTGEVIGSSTLSGTASEQTNLSNLAAGNNYYVRVFQVSGSTNYNLTLVSDYAGTTTATARNIGTPSTSFTTSYTDFVGSTGTGITDSADVYRFNVTTRSNLNVFLTDAGASANIQLLDSNGNVLQGALNGYYNGTTPAQTITRLLNSGTYYLRVVPTGTNSTNYTLNIAAPAVSPSLEWVKQLGSASQFDQATDVAVDSSGNVYVVGHTPGQLLGDNAGFYDGFLVKYNSSGVLQWTQEIETSTNDYVNAVAVDNAGNIYIGGSTQSNSAFGYNDAFVAKYNSSGTQLWIAKLDASTNDEVKDIALDSAGSLYITGITFGSLGGTNAGSYDGWLAKLSSSNGDTAWLRQFGTSGYDEANGVAVDSSGNVYVTGSTPGALSGTSAGSDDAFLIKYNSSGTQQWIRQFGISASDYAYKVAADSSGNVYVTGFTGGNLGGTGSGTSYLTSFTTTGTRRWTTQFGGILPTNVNDVKVDNTGNIYVAGSSQNAFGSIAYGAYDAYFLRFNSSGVVQQGTTLGTYATDGAFGIALDNAGNVYIAGTTFGTLEGASAYGTDIFVAKF